MSEFSEAKEPILFHISDVLTILDTEVRAMSDVSKPPKTQSGKFFQQ